MGMKMAIERTEEKSIIFDNTGNADKLLCRPTLSSELYITPLSLSLYEIYKSMNENASVNSRLLKVENLLRF